MENPQVAIGFNHFVEENYFHTRLDVNVKSWAIISNKKEIGCVSF